MYYRYQIEKAQPMLIEGLKRIYKTTTSALAVVGHFPDDETVRKEIGEVIFEATHFAFALEQSKLSKKFDPVWGDLNTKDLYRFLFRFYYKDVTKKLSMDDFFEVRNCLVRAEYSVRRMLTVNDLSSFISHAETLIKEVIEMAGIYENVVEDQTQESEAS